MSSRASAGEPLLLTVPEAARLLRVSPRWLWGQVWAGEIPSVRLGRLVRIPRAWLERYAEGAVVEWERRNAAPPVAAGGATAKEEQQCLRRLSYPKS